MSASASLFAAPYLEPDLIKKEMIKKCKKDSSKKAVVICLNTIIQDYKSYLEFIETHEGRISQRYCLGKYAKNERASNLDRLSCHRRKMFYLTEHPLGIYSDKLNSLHTFEGGWLTICKMKKSVSNCMSKQLNEYRRTIKFYDAIQLEQVAKTKFCFKRLENPPVNFYLVNKCLGL